VPEVGARFRVIGVVEGLIEMVAVMLAVTVVVLLTLAGEVPADAANGATARPMIPSKIIRYLYLDVNNIRLTPKPSTLVLILNYK
jgi:hypothetical protein